MSTGRIGPLNYVTENLSSPHILPFETPPLNTGLQVNFSNLDYYKEQWQRGNNAVLTDFFDEQSALNLWSYYYNKPDYEYDLAIFPDPNWDGNFEPNVYPLYRCKPGDPSIPSRIAHSLKVNDDGDFSYMYRRTEDYHPLLNCFAEDWFIKKLEYITGYENLQFTWDMTFISNYGPGHYNGPHTDGSNGRIAFVFHLSKDWKPWNGGLFLRMDHEWTRADAVISPSFNKFAMFNVFGDGYGAPHLVTEVAQGCTNRRISYTGWYQ